jgi:hypothetical protein
VKGSTLKEIRAGGRPMALTVAAEIARKLEPELWRAATGRRPRAQDVPAYAKRRRTRAEVLANMAEATRMRTAARLAPLEGELDRIEAERVDDDGAEHGSDA